MKKTTILISVLLLMLLLLTMPETSKEGAIAGLELCIYSVIPALFPYIILTNYLLSSGLYEVICELFYKIIGKLLKISKYGSFVIIIGLLCGYPMGAKLLGELHKMGKISRNESCYLITFCNNCSISFLINYIYLFCLNKNYNLGKLLLLIYIPIFISAIFNRFFFKRDNTIINIDKKNSFINPINNAIKNMTTLCCFVFLFTIIAYLMKDIVPINNNILYPIISTVELTSGTSLLKTINTPYQLLIICIAVIWGGWSTVMQSFIFLPSYLKKYYILGKVEQILCLLIIYFVIP